MNLKQKIVAILALAGVFIGGVGAGTTLDSNGAQTATQTVSQATQDSETTFEQAAVVKQTMHCWGDKRSVSLTWTRDQCLRIYPSSQGWKIVSATTTNGMWHVTVVRYLNGQTPQSAPTKVLA